MINLSKKALRTLASASDFQQQMVVPLRPADADSELYDGMMCFLQYTSALKQMVDAYNRNDFALADHYFRCATRVFSRAANETVPM